MRYLKYPLKYISKSLLKSIAVSLVVCVLILLGNIIAFTIDKQAAELDTAYSSLEIKVVVSDLTGTKTDGLTLGNSNISTFRDAPYDLHPYLKNICLKRSMILVSVNNDSYSNSDEAELIGITRLESDKRLNPENGVKFEFFDGYSDGMLEGDENICLISDELYSKLTLTEEPDTLSLVVIAKKLFDNEQRAVEAKLTIAGVVYGGHPNKIYTGWGKINELCRQSGIDIEYSESMSATLSDNRKLTEFKEKARRYYTNVSKIAHDETYHLALTVYDSVFNNTINKLEQNINQTRIIMSAIIIVSCAIGFITSLIMMRNRKTDFFTMRSIGINRKNILTMLIIEQLILSVAGLWVGILASGMLVHSYSIKDSSPLIALFLLGSFASIVYMIGSNVLEEMKGRE